MTLPYYERDGAQLYIGDSLILPAEWPENSADSCVTDPPYELNFMAKRWDRTGIANNPDLWRGILRVLKPGAHLLAFGGTRTHHRMVCAIEDAGFEIRDEIDWLYGQGFPKSLNFDGEWEGWGTALKPAKEPICLARKPVVGTIAASLQQWRTGALAIDSCRVECDGQNPSISRRNGAINHLSTRPAKESEAAGEWVSRQSPEAYRRERLGESLGRWPANIIHDGSPEVLAAFPESAGQLADARNDGAPKNNRIFGAMNHANGRDGEPSANSDNMGGVGFKMKPGARRGDAGSAARFFYCAKATKADREEGCDLLAMHTAAENVNREPDSAGINNPRAGAGRTSGRRNFHPTVKPTDLMRYLCRLITPPGGTVIDPFMGSGSTGKAAVMEKFRFIGIDNDPAYAEIAKARIDAALGPADLVLE